MIRVVIITVVVIVALKLAVSWFEPAMVFFPMRGEDDTPARVGIRYQALKLRASDGVEIAAWQLEPDAPKADIVYFHGNGGILSLAVSPPNPRLEWNGGREASPVRRRAAGRSAASR